MPHASKPQLIPKSPAILPLVESLWQKEQNKQTSTVTNNTTQAIEPVCIYIFTYTQNCIWKTHKHFNLRVFKSNQVNQIQLSA